MCPAVDEVSAQNQPTEFVFSYFPFRKFAFQFFYIGPANLNSGSRKCIDAKLA